MRPKRRAIPIATKREVCARHGGLCVCGCGQTVSEKSRSDTIFDHVPPIRIRNISVDGKDYDPHQHSAAHIDAICKAESDRRTFRRRGISFSDAVEIKRERKREKRRAGIVKPKKKWPKRKMRR